MKFFADTASPHEIEYCFSRGVDDGITTNPKILESTGDLSLGFEGACKSILSKYPNVPVSLETDLRGIDVKKLQTIDPEKVRDVLLEQAYSLSSWSRNVVIKIPICEGGLLAAKELASQGIRTNITACMTTEQALEAAKSGIGYVSLFANRMLDSYIIELAGHNIDVITSNSDWKKIVSENKEKLFEEAWDKTIKDIAHVASALDGKTSELIVGSIRSAQDILRIVKAKPQVITIPTKIVRELTDIPSIKYPSSRAIPVFNISLSSRLFHPMTQYTLEEFEQAADSYRQ